MPMDNGYADLAQRSGKVKALREQMLYANGYADLAADPNESQMSPFNRVFFRRLIGTLSFAKDSGKFIMEEFDICIYR